MVWRNRLTLPYDYGTGNGVGEDGKEKLHKELILKWGFKEWTKYVAARNGPLIGESNWKITSVGGTQNSSAFLECKLLSSWMRDFTGIHLASKDKPFSFPEGMAFK